MVWLNLITIGGAGTEPCVLYHEGTDIYVPSIWRSLHLSFSPPTSIKFYTTSVHFFNLFSSYCLLWNIIFLYIVIVTVYYQLSNFSSSNSSSFIWSHGSLHTHSPIHFHLIILSTFFTFNFIYLHSLIFYQSSLVSIKLHFLPFQASFITKPSQHHSFPDSPLSDLFLTRQAARLSVYYVFIISVSFLFKKQTFYFTD